MKEDKIRIGESQPQVKEMGLTSRIEWLKMILIRDIKNQNNSEMILRRRLAARIRIRMLSSNLKELILLIVIRFLIVAMDLRLSFLKLQCLNGI